MESLVLLPLSPQLLLTFSHTRTDQYITPLRQVQVDNVNRMIVHYAQEEFISLSGELRDEWFAPTGPLPADAYQESAADDGNEFEPLERPEMIDISRYPPAHPLREAMMR